MLVCNGCDGTYAIWVVVVARNAEICVDSTVDIVLRKGRLV